MSQSVDIGMGLRGARAYNPLVDYLRFGAAVVIVLFHTGAAFRSSDQAAVGFFAMAMTYFALAGFIAPKTDLPTYITARARRLLYPCLVWAALHVLGKAASAGFDPVAVRAEMAVWMPPEGTMGQLWFLPWAFVSSIALALAFRGRPPVARNATQAAGLILITLAVCIAAILCWQAQVLQRFWSIWVLYCVSLAIGTLLFALRGRSGHILAAGSVIAGAGLGLDAMGVQGTSQMTVAAPIFACALLFPFRSAPLARTLGTLSFFVYLCHVVVSAAARMALGIDLTTLPGALVAVALSILFAVFMYSTRFGKWLA